MIKGILKVLFSFIPWLFNFSDLPNYGSNSREKYTLRLLSKCLVRSTKELKFNGIHLSKNYIPSPKTLFADLSNITFNWLVIWKMTWEIRQAFSRALRTGTLMGSFNTNLKTYELKIHRGVICHDNEELHKIWRGTDLSFQSWHEEFDEFWPERLKVSKIFILMISFRAKYILFELKKYRRVIFHETEDGYKI